MQIEMRLEDKKIMQLRKANKISQGALAEAINSRIQNITRVENGIAQYSDEMLMLAKDFFKIKDMPISEQECATCKNRLYIMRDYVRDGRHKEARDICCELANLVILDPCDDELPMLYRLYEAILLIAERDIVSAWAKLNYIQSRLPNMNEEQLYYFNSSMGELNILLAQYEDALEYCMNAFEISEKFTDFSQYELTRLHVLVAICYTGLNFPYRAIFYVQKNHDLYIERGTGKLGLTSDLTLAINYIMVNNLKESERLLSTCLTRAMSIKDQLRTGISNQYIGFLHMKARNWQTAIDYFNTALTHFTKDSRQYMDALYYKIRTVAGSRKFAKAKKLLSETKQLYINSEVFSPKFEALSHYVTLSSRISLYNDESAEYIEHVAIPHFEKICEYFEAIDYYKLLEAYYEVKNNKKSLLMAMAIRRIYERCLFH